MIQSLHISGYRGFADFTAEGLARVNLIVGRNNAGKTALLEVVHLVCAEGDPHVFLQAALRRGELIQTNADPSQIRSLNALVDPRHLFLGHGYESDKKIRIQADDKAFEVRIEDIPPPPLGTEPSTNSATLTGVSEHPIGSRFLLFHFPLSPDGGILMDVASTQMARINRRIAIAGKPFPPAVFVPTSFLSASSLSSLWTEVQLRGAEEIVVNALKVIEPDIRSIVFLATGPRGREVESGAGIVVQMGDGGRVPLGSLGEGMKRMLVLATAIVAAAGGTLIVDEIDTGLHYSTLSRVWELVTAAAIANDVQVFATTHSADCVRGMEMLCSARPELQPEVALHKIVAGQRKSLRLGGDKLALALEGDLEVR